jgi:hypothetical protein
MGYSTTLYVGFDVQLPRVLFMAGLQFVQICGSVHAMTATEMASFLKRGLRSSCGL